MPADSPPEPNDLNEPSTFDRSDIAAVVTEWGSLYELRPDGATRLVGRDLDGTMRVRLTIPRSLPPLDEVEPGSRSGWDPGRWLSRCRLVHGRELYLCYQAGASAVGVWDRHRGGWLDRHVFRRYVVRGNGKAQATHLKTKGRSRYGSRLRLQNAERLLDETAEWIREALTVDGPVDCVLRSCDDRLFVEVRDACAKVFQGLRITTIPADLPRPDLETLDRARRAADRGTIETSRGDGID